MMIHLSLQLDSGLIILGGPWCDRFPIGSSHFLFGLDCLEGTGEGIGEVCDTDGELSLFVYGLVLLFCHELSLFQRLFDYNPILAESRLSTGSP